MGERLHVLIDTNVAYTYLSGRDDPYAASTLKVMELCSQDKIVGYLAFHSVSVIWYLARKMSEEKRREMLLVLCELLTVTGASHDAVVDAIKKNTFRDFEDCLQDKCALETGCDYIVTANIKDYAESDIPAVTPDQLLRLWEDSQ